MPSPDRVKSVPGRSGFSPTLSWTGSEFIQRTSSNLVTIHLQCGSASGLEHKLCPEPIEIETSSIGFSLRPYHLRLTIRPFILDHGHFSMHLAVLALHDWIVADERFVNELQEKQRLLHERHQDVFADLPNRGGRVGGSTGASCRAFASPLSHAIPASGALAGKCSRLVTAGTWRHDLASAGFVGTAGAGRSLPDAPGRGHRHVSAGGWLGCFPSRWCLADKMGKGLAAIHAPVPAYAEHLTADGSVISPPQS